MGIFRRDNHRRYGSPQRMEFRRFGTPTKETPKERSADEVFLGRRMFIFKSVAATCFAAITARVGFLQLGQRETAAVVALKQTLRKQVVQAPRGLITDRNGVVLAENRKAWGLALVRAKLPQLPDGSPDTTRREAMFREVEKYVPLEWAVTVKPLGPRATPAQAQVIAARLAPISDRYDDINIARLLTRLNDAPILLVAGLTKEEANGMRQTIGDVPGVQVLRYAEYLVSSANQPDPNRPTLVTRGLERSVALALDANVVDFPGMIVDETLLTRSYPAGELVSHVIGYVGPVTEEDLRNDPATNAPLYQKDDVIGRTGIEAALEADLRGTPGTRLYYVDSLEIDRGTANLLPATAGRNLELTLDLGLQRAARDALLTQMARAQAQVRKTVPDAVVNEGVAVALDPRNGEILAMVSLPAYNNQVFVDGTETARATLKAYFDEKGPKPMLNRAVQGEYPPGSTLKPFMAAGGLNEGVITPETTFNCPGVIYVPYYNDENQRDPKPCWVVPLGLPPHGMQNVINGIANSCDIYFYNVGAPRQLDPNNDQYLHYYEYGGPRGVIVRQFQGLGIERMDKYFTEFGFGIETGLRDLVGERTGTVPTPAYKETITKSKEQPRGDPWSLGDTINVTIGQGYFTCTPLQMAVATAAIANGGTFYRPHLVRRVLDENGNVVRTPDTTAMRTTTVKPEFMDIVRQGMRKVVTDGTGKGKITLPVAVAAKTGTAEFGEGIPVPGKPLKYMRQHAWFTAFAPYENPEIVVAVLIPGGGEGSVFSGPAANEILGAYFKSRAVAP